MTYQDILRRRSLGPASIVRTRRNAGDLVLRSWALPVEVHQPRGQVSACPRKG